VRILEASIRKFFRMGAFYVGMVRDGFGM